jgi:hypothetical protein
MKLHDIVTRARFFYSVARRTESLYAQLATMHRQPLLEAERSADPKLLTPYGYSAFSQNDEDGMIQEVFKRIGTTNRFFFEFGCGNGLESNSTYLLFTGWSGVWLDGSSKKVQAAQKQFASYVKGGRLKIGQAFGTAENINDLIKELGILPESDLLSIDIDGNDYWVWKALESERIRPRVVIIEYNATFRPPYKVVQTYNPARVNYRRDSFYGSSLKALEELGRTKGYALVGCSYSGVNALFVRTDLTGDSFSVPFTAEHHFRPPHWDAFVRGFNRPPPGAGNYEVL